MNKKTPPSGLAELGRQVLNGEVSQTPERPASPPDSGKEQALHQALQALRDAIDLARRAANQARARDLMWALRHHSLHVSLSSRGKKGAEKRWGKSEARERLLELVASLAGRKDSLGDYLQPSELWPELYSLMEQAGMAPREVTGETLEDCSYESDALPNAYTYKAFRKQIRRLRDS